MCLKGVLGSASNEDASVGVYPSMLDFMLGDIDSVTIDVMNLPNDKA